jgi:hypothetical protein
MHTVAEVGFWNDPKVVAFSLRVGSPDAGAWILRLREFVLLHGSDDGRLPGYSIEEIAAVMRPTCKPRVLFDALKYFNHLRRRRKTWYLPGWSQSQMGKYCKDRAWDRKRKRELCDARHQAALDQVGVEAGERTSGGHPVEVRRKSSGDLTVIKEGRPVDVPPAAPQRGVSGRASLARWEWFKSVYPKISSPERCMRLLANLTSEEWEHLQWGLPRQMASNRSLREAGRWCPSAPKYLGEKRFLELRRETPLKSGPKNGGKKKPVEVDPNIEKKRFATKYLFDFLADKDHPPEKRERLKKRYFETWGEKPWEKT